MSIRIMSSNLWGDYFGNPVSPRDKKLENIYRKYLPDVLGVQEMTENWSKSEIWENLKDLYSIVPVETNGEQNYFPLFYRNDKISLHDSGFHFYHKEFEPTKGYTWGLFKDLSTNRPFLIFNTHFMWKEGLEYDVIRRYNAMELITEMTYISKVYDCKAFFMGDLNCTVNSLAWDYLNSVGWYSAFTLAKETSDICTIHGDPVLGNDGFYHGSTTEDKAEASIDHIGIGKNCNAVSFSVITDKDALDATDHSPIILDVEL